MYNVRHVFVSTILLLIGSFVIAQEPMSSCKSLFEEKESEASHTAARDQLIQQYLFLNLSFPQNPEIIQLGLSAYYFARFLKTEPVLDLTAADVERVHTAMTRAHAAHGIKIDVSVHQSTEVLRSFLSSMVTSTTASAMGFMILPGRLRYPPGADHARRIEFLRSSFLNLPDYEHQRSQLERYSESLLQILRSPQVRNFSKAAREKVVGRNAPGAKNVIEETQAFIVSQLEIQHPELAQSMKAVLPLPLFDRGQTRAEVFLWAMQGSDLFLRL